MGIPKVDIILGNGNVGIEEMTYEATVLVDEQTLAIWSQDT